MKTLPTFVLSGMLTASIALGIGLGTGGSDAVPADPGIVPASAPTVAVAQPGIDLRRIPSPAAQPQSDRLEPASSLATFAIQPGVQVRDGNRAAEVVGSPPSRVRARAIQPGVPTPTSAATSRASADWTALAFAAAYDRCAAAALHAAISA